MKVKGEKGQKANLNPNPSPCGEGRLEPLSIPSVASFVE